MFNFKAMAILITTRILQASLVIVALAVFSPVAQASTGDQQIQIPSDLDKNDSLTPKRSANYLDTAAAAHQLIDGMLKNGMSAYGLVALLATLDDLTHDASSASTTLLKDDAVLALQTAETGCNDISELILHSTLRLIQAKELMIAQTAKQ